MSGRWSWKGQSVLTISAVVVTIMIAAAMLSGCASSGDGTDTGDVPDAGNASDSVSAIPVTLPDRYENERYGFSVLYDADVFALKEEPGEEGTVAVVMEAAGSETLPPAAVLTVVGPLESGTGEAGSEETMLSLKGNLPRLARRFGVELEGGVEEAMVGGLPGATAEISGPLPIPLEGEALYGRMSMTAWNGTAMIVIEGAAGDEWQTAQRTTLAAARVVVGEPAE